MNGFCGALLFSAALSLSPPAAWGQEKGTIELTSVSEVEIASTNDKGERTVKRVDASKASVAPGEIVIYTVRYVNKGDQPAERVVIRNPVPRHMEYVDKSSAGAGTKIEYSVDGRVFAELEKLTVRGQDGKDRPAGPADITVIRWTVGKPVPRGGRGSVSFRAKVK